MNNDMYWNEYDNDVVLTKEDLKYFSRKGTLTDRQVKLLYGHLIRQHVSQQKPFPGAAAAAAAAAYMVYF